MEVEASLFKGIIAVTDRLFQDSQGFMGVLLSCRACSESIQGRLPGLLVLSCSGQLQTEGQWILMTVKFLINIIAPVGFLH